MKNITEINEKGNLRTNGIKIIKNDDRVTDRLLNFKGGQQSLLQDGSDNLINCNRLVLNGCSMVGHKSRQTNRNLIKTQESRSQSLPSSPDVQKHKNGYSVSENENRAQTLLSERDNCTYDKSLILVPESELSLLESPLESPGKSEFWFKTWPERNKSLESNVCEENGINNTSKYVDIREGIEKNSNKKSKNNTFTLNEALQSISLAYSPVTKQLHYLENKTDCGDNKIESIESQNESSVDLDVVNVNKATKLGHRRNETGSFSSTVSSLSEPSPSGSLLDADEKIFDLDIENFKGWKRKGFTSFFNRSVFQWGSSSSAASVLDNNSGTSGWRLFGKRSHTDQVADVQNSPKRENIVASSTALIQHERPANLPAKDLDEEQRHREEYKAMVLAAKKREAKNSAAKQRQQRLQLQAEEQLATATKFWNSQVLPKWDSMYKTKKTRDAWWQGLPSAVRGKVWRLAIGNDLNLTQQLYEICLARAQSRLNNNNTNGNSNNDGGIVINNTDDFSQESSMDLIKLDIARTFPNLCIFQEGGPYSEILHTLLAAYVTYRPDVGYVQGMSFIAAILILNMEHSEAFVCFANLLNRPLHLAAFTLNQNQMQAYYSAYNEIFEYNLPKLFAHFENGGLTPDLYLLDWIYTVFSKAMPLDVACRVWDVFLRDGQEFIFRTALGILHLHQELLTKMDFIHGAQFLTKLPEDLSADCLFKSIQCIYVNIGKITFNQIVEKYKDS